MKNFKIIYFTAILFLLMFSACEKNGTHIVPKIKAIHKTFDIRGFVLGDTIEQYFDGIKMREYYGLVRINGAESQLAFTTDEINMELKRKSTGETLYKQKFNINDKDNIVPKFYFDGNEFGNTYSYPQPQGSEYLANFYLEAPTGSSPADLNIDVLEYYIDQNNNIVVVNTTSVPIAGNLQVGRWTTYLQLPAPPVLVPTQAGTDFFPIVTIRDSKTKAYYINNDRDQSTLQMEIPDQWTSSGKVQSIHIAKKIAATKVIYMEINDLVQLFP